jgi:hypothetical protein
MGLIALAVSVLANLLAFVFTTGPDWAFLPMRLAPLIIKETAVGDTFNVPSGRQILLGFVLNVTAWTIVWSAVLTLTMAVIARVRRNRQVA